MSAVSDSSQEASNAGNCSAMSASHGVKKDNVPNVHTGNLFARSTLLKSSGLGSDQAQKRRSSSRSIKRKKFDDELVESSLAKTSRSKPQNVTSSISSSAVTAASMPSTSAFAASTSQGQIPTTSTMITDKKKISRNFGHKRSYAEQDHKISVCARPISHKVGISQRTQKRIKKRKSNQANAVNGSSRWKPADDYLLTLCVMQTNDLNIVYKGVKFSSKFSLKEITQRWQSFLYDPSVSKAATYGMRQLSPEVRAAVEAKVLFNDEEEKCIGSVPANQGSLEFFENLLNTNPSEFLPFRTARALYAYWTQMKHYGLLEDQTSQPPEVENLLTLSDAEDLIDDDALTEPADPAVNEEVELASQKAMYEIKILENELTKLQVVVQHLSGVSRPDEFDNTTLAVLRGRVVRYLIQSKEVTIGRSIPGNTVDIDLSLEGPSFHVSRRQGMIKVNSNGDFFIMNDGRVPMFVDGNPVLSGNKSKIYTNSVIEMCTLQFIFTVNQEAVTALKAKNRL